MKVLLAASLAILLGCSKREGAKPLATESGSPSTAPSPTDSRITVADPCITLIRISPSKYGKKDADFFLQETEVTNSMFRHFLVATKRKKADDEVLRKNLEEEEKWERTNTVERSTTDASIWMKNRTLLWNGNTPPKGMEDYPVALVSVIEANEFCQWLTQKHPGLGTFRLPTVAEWTLAAYGSDRTFPWGSDWKDECLQFGTSSPEPVMNRPKGRTPDGVYGMFGNVNEFVIHPPEERNVTFSGVGARWLGGGFSDTSFKGRQDYWGYWHNSQGRSANIGIRVLLEVMDR